jgi:hypothetical protein
MEMVMSTSIDTRYRHLSVGQIAELGDGVGTLVVAEQGALWVTQAGDSRDIILEAGDSFMLDRDGRALVTALGGPADFRVSPPVAQAIAA